MKVSVVLQSLIALTSLFTNGGFMVAGLVQINKTSVANADIDYAKSALIGTMISQFAIGMIMLVAMILLFVYKDKLSEKASKRLINALMAVAGLTLFTGGAVSATISTRLQCYRSDANVQSAWKSSTISAIIGICCSVLLLAIQAMIKKDSIKNVLMQETVVQRRPKYQLIPEGQRQSQF